MKSHPLKIAEGGAAFISIQEVKSNTPRMGQPPAAVNLRLENQRVGHPSLNIQTYFPLR